MTPTRDPEVGPGPAKPANSSPAPVPKYELTFVESPNLFASIRNGFRAWRRDPRATVDKRHYRGEERLPIVEMRAWYRDLPHEIRTFLEPPRDPIGFFNRKQEEKRILSGLSLAILGAGAAAWWVSRGAEGVGLELIVGLAAMYGLGYGLGVVLFKKRDYPPDIWRDYELQPASWVNSLIVHALGLTALLLPFIVGRMVTPVRASTKYEVVDISPYLKDLPGAQNKSGGGGGGGDRSRTPASKGKVPVFAKQQIAPPMAKIVNPEPLMPVQPTLLGPPELKLPQMAANMSLGDPQAAIAEASNGPGFGGGIGTGDGGGIGSGHGGGLGPGDGGGTGGGPFSVGGNVSAPVAIYRPDPPYSEEARKAKFQGTVVIWIVVQADGSVSGVRVVKPLGLGLDENAVSTVKTWKFKPGMRNGVPVAVMIAVEVQFRLF